MKVQRNYGYVSTITFVDYYDTEEQSSLKNSMFNMTNSICGFEPESRLDSYDETILIFKSECSAIIYLSCLFREIIKHENTTNCLKLRSGLCQGDYFVYQDQIYGDAVNLATKLSYCSRQNEILVKGIDQKQLQHFTEDKPDVIYTTRNLDSKCYSINLLDTDITNATINSMVFDVKYNDQRKKLEVSRYKKITIGRSSEADLFIDDSHISRNHATITFNHDDIFIEDHSSNGTYIYIDGHEKYITNDSTSLCGKGYILCGLRKSNTESYSSREIMSTMNMISFELCKQAQ